jgi:glutamine amidotransferase
LLFIHNGYIDNFRLTLYLPIRNQLCDDTYRSIHGNIDSEHIFALTIGQLKANPSVDLATALETGLKKLIQLSQTYDTFFSANMIISDGTQLVAFRYSNRNVSPTLYYLALFSRSSIFFRYDRCFRAYICRKLEKLPRYMK